MSDQTTPSDKSSGFQPQLEELEQIVTWFESEDVDIDQALEKFQRGMELVSHLEQWLEEAENTVQEITETFDQDTPEEAEDTDKGSS